MNAGHGAHGRRQGKTAASRSLDNLDMASLPAPVPARALAKLKFSACLPDSLARAVLTARLTDNDFLHDTLARPRRLVAGGASEA